MNISTPSFNWNHARAFLATAELGSLSAAATALRISQPTLGRQVTALEESLSVSLFERSGRGLELTPNGLELLEFVRTMDQAASEFSLTAAGKSATVRGVISITATEMMAAFVLPPIIEKLQSQEPEIQVELIASNSTSNLKRREADIALRAYRPTQEDLISKKLGEFSGGLAATPAYLESLGPIDSVSDLNKAKFIGFSRGDELLTGLNHLGLSVSKDNFTLYAENHLVFWELMKQGLGIGVGPKEVIERDAGLVSLFAEQLYFPYELWLTAHRELRTSLRVRTVFDFLDAELRQETAA